MTICVKQFVDGHRVLVVSVVEVILLTQLQGWGKRSVTRKIYFSFRPQVYTILHHYYVKGNGRNKKISLAVRGLLLKRFMCIISWAGSRTLFLLLRYHQPARKSVSRTLLIAVIDTSLGPYHTRITTKFALKKKILWIINGHNCQVFTVVLSL